MNYNVKTIDVFEKQAKRLLKKYASFKGDLAQLINSLKEDPGQGSSLGNGCFKIRFAIASKGKGKRGSARAITTIMISEKIVYLLSVYDKGEKETISDKELKTLLKHIPI